jgi:ectoine hydrolase
LRGDRCPQSSTPTKPRRGAFERSEYAARIAKTRTAMQRAGIDLLIVTDPTNMAWLTGYDGWSFYVHQCVLLPMEGEPVWYGRAQDANGAKRTAFMTHETSSATPTTTCSRRTVTRWTTWRAW